MSSARAPVESCGGRSSHGDNTPEASAKKLLRVMQAVYLVVVKKHQPKLAALGVHLHHLLASKRDRRGAAAARRHPALTYLSSLSCRSMDPAAAVVHPYPCGAGAYGHRRQSSGPAPSVASLSSLSCRSMDPAAAVVQYQYRPREVEFSCKSTPPRRRAQRRALRLQHGAGDHSSDQEHYGSAATVTTLFQLMDVKEEAEAACVVDDSGNLDQLESAAAWPALTTGPAARQVRITDSPFQGREDDEEDARGAVDRRADEFIMWFHEQLRTQQQQQRNTHYRII